ALTLTVQRLTYVAPPEGRPEVLHPVKVRTIQTRAELQEYFQLRHRVYRVMGYLDEATESAPSRMEIDRCDTTALHVGAFEQEGPRQRLVGTARVVAIEPLDQRDDWTWGLARRDPVLKRVLERNLFPLGLPIFQSMGALNPVLTNVLLQEQNC